MGSENGDLEYDNEEWMECADDMVSATSGPGNELVNGHVPLDNGTLERSVKFPSNDSLSSSQQLNMEGEQNKKEISILQNRMFFFATFATLYRFSYFFPPSWHFKSCFIFLLFYYFSLKHYFLAYVACEVSCQTIYRCFYVLLKLTTNLLQYLR